MVRQQKSTQVKSLSKILLVVYLLVLLWLVLFKFSFDIISILQRHQIRSLNLIPFKGQLKDMAYNFVVFIPFGLLLSITFKKVASWQRLSTILAFSVAIELIQFALAIGVTDITDVMMNTLGGLFGLLGYGFCKKYVDSKRIDHILTMVCTLLIVAFLIFRIFILKIRY